MCPHGYYTLLRESKDPRYLRLRLVQYAKQQGVKPAARAFDVQPRIVRKWCDRYDGTLASLQDQSRAPKHQPNRTPPEDEEKIVTAKKKLPMLLCEALRSTSRGGPQAEDLDEPVLLCEALRSTSPIRPRSSTAC